MPKDELWFEVKTPNTRWRRVSPDGIGQLPQFVREEMTGALKELADEILGELKFLYQQMIRSGRGSRARNASYTNGSNKTLMRRMVPAMIKKIMGNRDLLQLVVFDLKHMDWVTRGEGKKTWSRGWFLRFADGHVGRSHGSNEWGFLSQRYAKRLAERCIVQMGLNEKQASELRMLVNTKFKGRHNEGEEEDGIMVALDKPLFFAYPQFGKAEKFVSQHPGYRSWPALDIVSQKLRGQTTKTLIEDAMEQAFERLE